MASPKEQPRSTPTKTSDDVQLQIPTIRVVDFDDNARSNDHTALSVNASQPDHSTTHDILEEDIDLDPQAHFLSPVQMYEAWDDSDDGEDDGIEWDAGIMDFALFSEDQRRARDENLPLDSKWNDLLSNQAAAYERSTKRTNDYASEPDFLSRNSSGESLPDLTPDNSPRMQDNLEYEDEEDTASHDQGYRTVIVTPDSVPSTKRLESITESDSAVEDEDEDTPLSFFVQRQKLRRRQSMPATPQRLQRPGLRNGRTLSGKLHVWRRPSWDIWQIPENASDEERAEAADAEVRGR